MKVIGLCLLALACLTTAGVCGAQPAPDKAARLGKVAAKPLFRDPVHDGAADPVVVWNRRERRWFMLYTNRRANDAAATGVTWVHGTRIGVAEPGSGADDEVIGQHADVVVSGGRAFLFYFTHPGRRGEHAKEDGYEQRRSSIQVVELEDKNGEVTCDRDRPTRIRLLPPGGKE